MAEKSSSKEQTIFHISACALTLEISKGHLKWMVTELERKSGVSRSLIYRYLGSTKKEILRNAFEIFVKQFYGLEKKAYAEPLPKQIKRARQQIIDYPETALFYQKWRMIESDQAREFMRIEEKFQKKLRKLFPRFSQEEILAAHACIHGLATAPFLSPEQSEIICEQLLRKGVLAAPAGA